MEEKIIDTKKCKCCSNSFDISSNDLNFYQSVSPIFDGNKISLPTPTYCPDCRQQIRMNWRNERKLYKRKCDLTGKPIIAIYSPDVDYKVYGSDAWRSDKRDPLEYGFDFDFNKTFTEQLDKLLRVVPHLNLYCLNNENSDYTHGVTAMKNCYLLHNSDYVEDSFYCTLILSSKDCVDCNMMTKCEIAYDSYNCTNCCKVFFSQDCDDCTNITYCNNCRNCNDCFMCSSLVNKQYCIRNKQYTKGDYEAKVLDIKNNNTIIQLKNQAQELFIQFPVRYYKGINNQNSAGNYLNNTKNAVNCYQCNDVEDCKNCIWIFNSKNCQDFTVYGDGGENIYNSAMTGPNGYNIISSAAIWHDCRDILYSFLMISCSNCFGCVGLRHKQYCIFNQQYTKQEYDILVPKIILHMQKIGEWGEFFDKSICPWGYNETMGMDYLPMTRERALSHGYKRMDKEYPINVPQGIETIDANDLPDITNITDDILNKAIICSQSGKPYRIIKPELDFYRKYGLPIPKLHYDVRYTNRVGNKLNANLYQKNCDKCGIDLITTFSPNNPQKVYCEKCYNKEIYG